MLTQKKHKLHCAPSVKAFTVSAGAAGQCLIKDDQKRREIRIAAYIACHTSINAVDDLSDILKDEMGTFQMHRHYQICSRAALQRRTCGGYR